MTQSSFLDARLQPCKVDQAAFMRVTLAKVATSPFERVSAQALQGGLRVPDDLPDVPATAGSGGEGNNSIGADLEMGETL
jgi:hypothetical protein